MKKTIASHNIGVLFWAQFFGTVSFLQPVITLFYMERGLDPGNIFIVMMFWSGAVLIGEVPTGVFADRFGPKVSFITGSTIKMLSIFILFFAKEPWVFFLYSALNGLSVTFFSGADEALVYESLKITGEQGAMDKAMGKIQSAGFISMIAAVLFGSYFAKDLQNHEFIILIALGLVFQFIELILLFFIRKPDVDIQYRENPFHQIGEGVQAIKKAPQLLVMFLNITLVFIPAGAVFSNFDQPFLTGAGLPVYMIGVIYSIAAFIAFAASRSIGWMTGKYSRIFLLNLTGAAAVGGLLLAVISGNNLLMALVSFFILRFVRAIRYPIYSQLSNDLIPSDVRATSISLLSILDSVFDLLIFGSFSIIAVYGLSKIFMACAVIACLGALLPIRRSRSTRSLSGVKIEK
ncbi:MFS transporter [Falsibacillus albus]|uniref:MFS transporter n=1 Tax=Falsibacillus albus TaxID=2478915 RepID=A0A3L7JXP3_9BACI|nr:MFS transporter [Falsibacillus albus]RLQ93202.1 MFS transporter [Falsibacillus albus]